MLQRDYLDEEIQIEDAASRVEAGSRVSQSPLKWCKIADLISDVTTPPSLVELPLALWQATVLLLPSCEFIENTVIME